MDPIVLFTILSELVPALFTLIPKILALYEPFTTEVVMEPIVLFLIKAAPVL